MSGKTQAEIYINSLKEIDELSLLMLSHGRAGRWDELTAAEEAMTGLVSQLPMLKRGLVLSEEQVLLEIAFMGSATQNNQEAMELLETQVNSLEDFLVKGAKMKKVANAYLDGFSDFDVE